jgi:hypothetical protein
MCFLFLPKLLQANRRKWQVKKQSLALALCASLGCSPVWAKTFVGVLWPMFGPLAAGGLVELVAELRMMPDVEVRTYLHQSWPSLVQDIDRQPPGTHSVVVGYSLGANSSCGFDRCVAALDVQLESEPLRAVWGE